jgi:hypothetical protein
MLTTAIRSLHNMLREPGKKVKPLRKYFLSIKGGLKNGY